MKLRKSYHIAGHDYKILKGTSETLPQLKRKGEKDFAGDCNFEKEELSVNSSHGEDEQFSTFLHEATHVIDKVFNIKLSEEQVMKLERGFFMLLKDNFNLTHKNRKKK